MATRMKYRQKTKSTTNIQELNPLNEKFVEISMCSIVSMRQLFDASCFRVQYAFLFISVSRKHKKYKNLTVNFQDYPI